MFPEASIRTTGREPARELDEPPRLGRRPVVQKQEIGAGLEGFAKLGLAFHLDLDPQAERRAKPRGGDGRGNAPGDRNVVVLDQDSVVEPEAMVRSPAGDDRPLVERAKARRRLARVENPGGRSTHGLDVTPGLGRDARHSLEEIEGDPFPREQAPGAARDLRDFRSRGDALSFRGERSPNRTRVGEAKDFAGDLETARDEIALGEKKPFCPSAFRHDGPGSDVTAADVLREEHLEAGLQGGIDLAHAGRISRTPAPRPLRRLRSGWGSSPRSPSGTPLKARRERRETSARSAERRRGVLDKYVAGGAGRARSYSRQLSPRPL